MNKKLVSVMGAIVVVVLMVSTVSAQGIPGSGWWTGEQVQNVGSSTATVNITAYDKNSTATYQTNVTLTVGSSVNFGPTSLSGMPAGFIGSAVVSSDQPVKAIVNVTNQLTSQAGVSGGKAAAQYQGTETTDTTLYFPLVKNNRYGNTTAFYIQNAGSGDTTVRAVFKMDNGGVYTFTTGTVSPNKMVLISPSDAGVPSSPSDGTRVNIGSLTITSVASQPLAGTVLEYTVGETVATALKGTRGFTAADFDTKAYAPVVKKNSFGRFTGVQVQNVSSSPITVTIDYVGTRPSCRGVTTQDVRTNVLPGTSTTVVQLSSGSNFTDQCTGSATITASGNFVAVVNEDNMTGSPKSGAVYFAIPDHSATTKLSAPLFKNNRFGFDTGFQIQNVGGATATNVVATFACKGNNSTNTPFTAVSNPQTIASGAAKLFFKPYDSQQSDFTAANPFSLTGANCGVTVTSDQKIVAIANETPRTAGALDDNNYEGFNLTP
jgi:hypothetical protein